MDSAKAEMVAPTCLLNPLRTEGAIGTQNTTEVNTNPCLPVFTYKARVNTTPVNSTQPCPTFHLRIYIGGRFDNTPKYMSISKKANALEPWGRAHSSFRFCRTSAPVACSRPSRLDTIPPELRLLKEATDQEAGKHLSAWHGETCVKLTQNMTTK